MVMTPLFHVRQYSELVTQASGFAESTTCGTVPDRGWNDDDAVNNLALPRACWRFRMRRLLWIRNDHD
jgi:hypothetical protein